MEEEWRPVVGYEGFYEVSSHGRVKSVSRIVKGRRRSPLPIKETFRKLQKRCESNHLFVNLWKDNREKRKDVHRLVLEAFVGPCPDGMQCRHLNGIACDNKVKNLRWGTVGQNISDKIRHGTMPRGATHWNAVLSEDDVVKIRELKSGGLGNAQIADVFEVNYMTIYDIVKGRRWGWFHG